MVDTITITDSIGQILYNITDTIDTCMAQNANTIDNYLYVGQQPDSFSWLKYIIPAALSLIVSVGAFYIGKCIEKRSEKRKKKKIYEQIIRTIKATVASAEGSYMQLLEGITDFIKKTKDSNQIILEQLGICKIYLDSLKQYSIQELSLAFITNKEGDKEEKSRKLYLLVSSIDYLNECFNYIKEYYNESSNHADELNKKWTECKKQILNYNARYINEHKYPEITEQFSTYAYSSERKTLQTFMPKEMDTIVISPMLDFVSLKNYFEQHRELIPYIETLRDMRHLIEESEVLHSKVSKKLSEYYNEIVKGYKTLEDAIKFLEENKFVKLRKIE